MVPWIIAGLGVGVAAAATARVARLVAKHEHRGWPVEWPIRRVSPEGFDPIFRLTSFGPSLETVVRYSSSMGVHGGTSDREAWILAVLATRARIMFEFGTCTGKTTHLLAMNSPADAIVHTLTLAQGQEGQYAGGAGDDRHDTRAALRESSAAGFVYSNTPEESKIRQHYGDSKAFDQKSLAGKCDLVFVDGSHAYSYVVSDSRKALEMVAPGGMVLWHDYRGFYKPRGVYKALNELAKDVELVHLKGTSLIAYRRQEKPTGVSSSARE
jgi:hypothetical protein